MSSANSSSLSDESKLDGFKKMPAAIKALLTNPTYIFISLGAAADGLVIAGLSAFLPKFIQSQYKFTASLSAAIVGKLIFLLIWSFHVVSKKIQICFKQDYFFGPIYNIEQGNFKYRVRLLIGKL